MTDRLRAALQAHRHLRGERVLYTDAGETATAKVLQKWIASAQKRAQLRASGALHILRHTFCSHLAMRGATALSIQKLAGHKNLQTTPRYMHLAEGETDRAIRLLNGPRIGVTRGDILETTEPLIANINGSA
jgi:site-specific recombinase XerD